MNEEESLLNNLKNDIDSLCRDIKNIDLNNRKIKRLRFLKKCLQIGKIIAPATLIISLTFGIFSFGGAMPFSKKNLMKKVYYKNVYDSHGNIRSFEQVDAFSDSINKIDLVDVWEMDNDGFYSRNIKSYFIDDELINKIYESSFFDSIDESVLGKPLNETKERKNKLNSDDMYQDKYFEITVYDNSESDFQMVGTISLNDFYTVIWFISNIILLFGSSFILSDYYKHQKNILNDINENNPLLNKDILIKKLEVKKDTYNRLSGGSLNE